MRFGWLFAGALFLGCAERSPPVSTGRVDAAARPVVRDAAPMDSAVDSAVDAGFTITMGEPVFAVEITVGDAAVPPPKPPKKRLKRRWRRRAPRADKTLRRAPKAVVAPTAMGTIRRNMKDIEQCYGQVALKDPTIKGRIVLQWTLGSDGMPTATRLVKDTLKDKSVGRCIKRRAKRWRFPPPSGGISVVTYPFDLRVQ